MTALLGLPILESSNHRGRVCIGCRSSRGFGVDDPQKTKAGNQGYLHILDCHIFNDTNKSFLIFHHLQSKHYHLDLLPFTEEQFAFVTSIR